MVRGLDMKEGSKRRRKKDKRTVEKDLMKSMSVKMESKERGEGEEGRISR